MDYIPMLNHPNSVVVCMHLRIAAAPSRLNTLIQDYGHKNGVFQLTGLVLTTKNANPIAINQSQY